jgi:hypothetical protein
MITFAHAWCGSLSNRSFLMVQEFTCFVYVGLEPSPKGPGRPQGSPLPSPASGAGTDVSISIPPIGKRPSCRGQGPRRGVGAPLGAHHGDRPPRGQGDRQGRPSHTRRAPPGYGRGGPGGRPADPTVASGMGGATRSPGRPWWPPVHLAVALSASKRERRLQPPHVLPVINVPGRVFFLL